MFRVVPQLTVANINRSVEFYTQRLGFVVTLLDTPEDPVFASLEREETTLFLVSESSREEAYQVADLAANKRGVGVHLFFEVDDAREMYEHLRTWEITFLRDIATNEKEDYTEFSFLDPDGYEIGIYS